MKIVMDSSVALAAMRPEEQDHRASVAFLDRVRERGDELLAPATILWEVGGTLAHPGKTPVTMPLKRVPDAPQIKYVTVDRELFDRTWRKDKRVPAKGSDRVFISCARKWRRGEMPRSRWFQRLFDGPEESGA